MTEEELREKIATILTEWNTWNCEDRGSFKYDYAEQILTLFREAGYDKPCPNKNRCIGYVIREDGKEGPIICTMEEK